MPRVRQNDPIVIGNINPNPHNFNFNIDAYYGDPSSLSWFIQQVTELKELNQWNDATALFFLKSKLKGSAQQFFATSPSCKNIQTFQEAVGILQAFFHDKPSSSSAIADFNSLNLLPNETIKNFAYRIDTAAHAAYSFIDDAEALNRIKSIQFLNALPQHIKSQLLFENQADFINLVNKASQLYNVNNSNNAQQYVNVVQNDNSEIQNLKDQVAQLTSAVKNLMNACPVCKGEHTFHNCPEKSQENFPKQNHDSRFQNRNKNIKCHFCGKTGHLMASCFRYLNSSGQGYNARPANKTRQPNNARTFHRSQNSLN